VRNNSITFYSVYAPHGILAARPLTLGGGRSAPLLRATDIVSLQETMQFFTADCHWQLATFWVKPKRTKKL
jgi:hypothetical protein